MIWISIEKVALFCLRFYGPRLLSQLTPGWLTRSVGSRFFSPLSSLSSFARVERKVRFVVVVVVVVSKEKEGGAAENQFHSVKKTEKGIFSSFVNSKLVFSKKAAWLKK
jgi:hypothetical protein